MTLARFMASWRVKIAEQVPCRESKVEPARGQAGKPGPDEGKERKLEAPLLLLRGTGCSWESRLPGLIRLSDSTSVIGKGQDPGPSCSSS